MPEMTDDEVRISSHRAFEMALDTIRGAFFAHPGGLEIMALTLEGDPWERTFVVDKTGEVYTDFTVQVRIHISHNGPPIAPELWTPGAGYRRALANGSLRDE